MTPEQVMGRIAASTAAAGMPTEQTTLPGGPVLVARTSDFRWRWMATRLHTFLVGAPFPPGTATPAALDHLLTDATDYAVAHKGGLPPGFQTGVAVLIVAVTAQVDDAARGWARSPHGRRFATMPFPVLADTATGELVFPARMVIGALYTSYLQELARRHVGGALATTPAGG